MSPTGIGDPKKGGDSTENLYLGQRVLFSWTMGILFYLQPTSQSLSKNFFMANSTKKGEDDKFEISKEENLLIGQIRRMHFN